MKQAGIALTLYAKDHGGRFPRHPSGYGDALSLLRDDTMPFAVTGPGYSEEVFKRAWATPTPSHVEEALCGRVYVQGLAETNDPRIAVLFDKVAAPPDHCHFPQRLWAEFVREVWTIGEGHRIVPVDCWPTFASNQVELLMQAGFTRSRAEALYSQVR